MTVVSRLELDHPALGTPGGSALHASIEALYTKIGDNINARYFTAENLNNGSSQSFDHNFNISSFDDLRYDLYLWNTGTGELTLVSADDLADWTIEATPGSEKTHIRVTNNTGSQQDIALVVLQDPITLDELADVIATGAEDGQALVYRNSDKKWVPGASGDSSFKIQSLLADGTITIKGGYVVAADGRVLATYDGAGTAETDFGGDLSFDLDSLITASPNTTYWLYVDLYSLPAAIPVTGGVVRDLTPVVSTNFYLSTTPWNLIDQYRYLKVGITRYSAASWSTTIVTFPSKVMVPGIVVSPLVASIEKTIGVVGDVDQVAAGHVLAQGSFPSAAYAATSFYNLTTTSTISDGNTSLAHDLTNNGSSPFTGTGILGIANSCLNLAGTDGSAQYLYSTDIHFDPDDANFTCGGWFNPTSWTPSTDKGMFAQWNSSAGNCRSFGLVLMTSGVLRLATSIDGTNSVVFDYTPTTAFSGWQHIALKYSASANTFYLYVNSILVMTSVLSAGLFLAGANRKFVIGQLAISAGYYYAGLIDEFFFCNGTAFTDDDIYKIYAAKISHNSGLAPSSQDWRSQITYSGQVRDLVEYIVDKDQNDLYVDLSGQSATAVAKFDLLNKGLSGSVSISRSKEWIDTATNLDTMFGTTPAHGLPAVPKLILEVDLGGGYWEQHDAATYLKASATAIAQQSGETLAAALGGSTNCKVTAYCGNSAAFVQAKSWQTLVKSAAYSLVAYDEVLANPTGQMILTLPANPSLGDRVRVIDFDGTWSLTDYVRVARNGKKIHGASDDLDLTTSGDSCELVYNGTDDWRII